MAPDSTYRRIYALVKRIPRGRVLNREGRVSPRSAGDGSLHQRALLEGEGVVFDRRGRCDLDAVGWRPRRSGAARPPRPATRKRRAAGRARSR